MEIKAIIKKLSSNSEFKKWKQSNKDYYLVHCFKMLDEANEDEWQIGYYNSKKDSMVTFLVQKDDIKMVPEKDIFRKERQEIQEIKLEKVKLSLEKILDIAKDFTNKKYAGETRMKTIILLQHLDIGQVWNITFLTNSFKTLNLKINSENGKVLKHELTSLLQFGAG